MKINYWISNALLSVGLFAGVTNPHWDRPNPPAPPSLRGLGGVILYPRGEYYSSRYLLALSQQEKEELQQLRQDQKIRDRVQSEVDRAFSRATTFINFLLFLIILFPLMTVFGLWLLRRRIINQLVSETRNELEQKIRQQLEKEITDNFYQQTASLKPDMEKFKSEFVEHTNQLHKLYIDAQKEKDQIMQQLSNLRSNCLEETIISEEVYQPIIDSDSDAVQEDMRFNYEVPTESEILNHVPDEQSDYLVEIEESPSIENQPVFSADDYLNQGNIHLVEGRYLEANQCYNEAVKIDRNFPEARYQNAKAYALRSSINPAIGNLQWAIDLDPKYKKMAKDESAFNRIRDEAQFKDVVKE